MRFFIASSGRGRATRERRIAELSRCWRKGAPVYPCRTARSGVLIPRDELDAGFMAG